jgi:hypothetical protein
VIPPDRIILSFFRRVMKIGGALPGSETARTGEQSLDEDVDHPTAPRPL